jgi:hypothetical protein
MDLRIIHRVEKLERGLGERIFRSYQFSDESSDTQALHSEILYHVLQEVAPLELGEKAPEPLPLEPLGLQEGGDDGLEGGNLFVEQGLRK